MARKNCSLWLNASGIKLLFLSYHVSDNKSRHKLGTQLFGLTGLILKLMIDEALAEPCHMTYPPLTLFKDLALCEIHIFLVLEQGKNK